MGLYDSPYLTKAECEARSTWSEKEQANYTSFCEQRCREASKKLTEFLQVDSLCLITDTYMGMTTDEQGNLVGKRHSPSIVTYMGITDTMGAAQILDVQRFDPETNGYLWKFSDPQKLEDEEE